MTKKLSREEIIDTIDKILLAEGTDEEEDLWLEQLSISVPYYQEIYRIIATSTEDLTAKEILDKAKTNHKPIIL
ncbi:hypothetical protein HPY28_16835 [Brevibacillus sp. HB1.2]|uniref:hypothetical protein n=1 Tax=Brevibacillus sp. HB1.2 TaxID=2738807 RepID=UPI001576ACF6|nr:hypothetical protein [Brevibacillus sp. HB1.2]NTU21993.1 hypothetical protein [Brevibacillus sp. HB1.2]